MAEAESIERGGETQDRVDMRPDPKPRLTPGAIRGICLAAGIGILAWIAISLLLRFIVLQH